MAHRSISTRRWTDVATVCLVIVAIGAGSHFWITDRLGVLRAVYPVQAQLTRWTTHCNDRAPEWMRKAITQSIDLFTSPANQLAYISPDGELFHCENGWIADVLRSPEVNASTRFRFASITKVFTADAVLELVADGRLALDTRLLDLFPELPPPQDQRVADISIDHLLTHRAGFDRHASIDPLFAHNQEPWCPHRMEELSFLELDYAPGERQIYSNRGFCLLGQVIERIVELPLRQYMRERYALTESGLRFVDGPYLPDEIRYDFRNHDFYMANYHRLFDFNALSAVAGLSGSAVVLADSVNRMLERKTFNLLSRDAPEDCDTGEIKACYGYAFYIYQPSDLKVHIHEGYLPGTTPILIVDAQGGVVALLPGGRPLTNDKREEMVRFLYEALAGHYKL